MICSKIQSFHHHHLLQSVIVDNHDSFHHHLLLLLCLYDMERFGSLRGHCSLQTALEVVSDLRF